MLGRTWCLIFFGLLVAASALMIYIDLKTRYPDPKPEPEYHTVRQDNHSAPQRNTGPEQTHSSVSDSDPTNELFKINIRGEGKGIHPAPAMELSAEAASPEQTAEEREHMLLDSHISKKHQKKKYE